MRNKPFLLAVAVLVVLAMAACSAAQAAPLAQTGEADTSAVTRTVMVTGSGRITLTPDLATISIGVHTENENARQAVSANSTQVEGVIGTLQDEGIAEEDIRTTNFSIYPRTNYDRDGNPLETVYVVDNTVLVTIRDLDGIGAILEAVVQAGANSIAGIQFDVADRSAAEADALSAAVADARSRAEVLVDAAGVELGEVQTINTSISGGPPPVIMREVAEFAQAAEVPISPGQMEVTAMVTVVYEIR